MASSTRNDNNTSNKNKYCEPCMFVKLKNIQAEFFCEDCLENYCDECALDHAKFRVLRNHHVLHLTEDSIEENNDGINNESWSTDNIRVHESVNASPVFENDGTNGGALITGNTRVAEDKDILQRNPFMDLQGVETGFTFTNVGGSDRGYLNAVPTGGGLQDTPYYNSDADNGKNDGFTNQEELDQFDRLSMHSYEDMDGPENGGNAVNVNAALDKKTEPEKQFRSTINTDSASFDIKVIETALTKRINEVQEIDLPNMATQLRLGNTGFTLASGSTTLVTCSFSIIRRYGVKDGRVSIELGRAFRYGEGFIKLEHDKKFDLYNAMKDRITKRQ